MRCDACPQEKLIPPELSQWIPPAAIVAIMLYLHRSLRQDLRGIETRLDGVESQIASLRKRMGRLEERMARLEGTLDVLREFFLHNGRGTAA